MSKHEERKRLRELAMAATPNCEAKIYEKHLIVRGEDCNVYWLTRDPVVLQETWDRQVTDARLFAQSRAAVLGLLDDVDRLRAAVIEHGQHDKECNITADVFRPAKYKLYRPCNCWVGEVTRDE